MTTGTGRHRGDPAAAATFLDHALAGRVKPAVGVALALLDAGLSAQAIVSELLAPAQREVGRRWEANALSVADEHLATGSAEASLHALAMAQPQPETTGHVVLACAEGDWHSTASHMFGVQLAASGVGVRFLGASTPAPHVATLLERQRPDALVVSCTMPIYFSGVTRLADAAHALGLPVLVGGGAFADDGCERARRLGADAWAPDVTEAVTILAEWRSRPPAVPDGPTALPRGALQLGQQAQRLAIIADDARAAQTRTPGRKVAQTGLTRDDLTLVLQFLAAAQLVESDEVFLGFLAWLGPLLTTRGLPEGELDTELESLATCLPGLSSAIVALLRLGATSSRAHAERRDGGGAAAARVHSPGGWGRARPTGSRQDRG